MSKLTSTQLNNNAAFPSQSAIEIGLLTRIGYFLRMVDIGHTLFALPFAYLGAFLAAGGIHTLTDLWWITVAMVGARTAALCLNRMIDRHIDARNPRTAGWILPQRLVSLSAVWGSIFVSFFLMLWAAAKLNPLCVKLAPLAVMVLVIYSYTKRFTWTCHLILGLAIGLGPLGAWIAITESIAWTPVLVYLAVAFWIAGFDMMYACQDEEFDRQEGLYSVPARFGTPATLRISTILHGLTICLLIGVGVIQGLGWLYYIGIGIAATILCYEHWLITPNDLSKMHTAAFQLNRYVSLILFVFTLIDLVWI
ncbi:MAG: UbiA-like polyprenyltransferase [Bacillota bacterium]|jgi:4-hydroxybenzoate polyprenyltransferase